MIKAISCIFVIVTLATTVPCEAGTTPTSTITQIKVIAKSNPKYRLYHGALWLDHDKQRYNYRWGGAHCANGTLSELKVSMLFAALRSKYNVDLDFKEHLYKGSRFRCIIGFTIRRS